MLSEATRAFAEATTDRGTVSFSSAVAGSMTVPLMCRGKVVGIANLVRSSPDHPYDLDDLQVVRSVADHAALAIADARSYAAERAARDAAEKATHALQRAKARIARLLESGIIGILEVGLDGRVVEANDAVLDLLRYSHDEILSGSVAWKNLTPPEGREADSRAVEQLKASGIGVLREKEYIRKDGMRVPVLVGSALLHEDRGLLA